MVDHSAFGDETAADVGCFPSGAVQGLSTGAVEEPDADPSVLGEMNRLHERRLVLPEQSLPCPEGRITVSETRYA